MTQSVTHPPGSICHPSIRVHSEGRSRVTRRLLRLFLELMRTCTTSLPQSDSRAAATIGNAGCCFIVGDGGQILSIIPVNTEDDVLHLLLGLAGIAAGLATAEAGRAAPAGRATI